MSDWDFFDERVLRKRLTPTTLGKKSGFTIYDDLKTNPVPEYYGIVISSKIVQRQMFEAGINGGYSLLKKTNEKDAYISTPHTIVDFEKARKFPIMAHHVFGIAPYNGRSFSIFCNHYPEMEGFMDGQLKNLLTMLENGATFENISSVTKIPRSDLVALYFRLKR